MKGVVRFALAVALIAAAGAARASGDTQDVARARFQSGSRHYDLREYDQALDDFKEVFRLTGDPSLLFNVAQCQRLLKHWEDALAAYKRFLVREPDSPVRGDVEGYIQEIETILAQQPPKPGREPAPQPDAKSVPVAPVVAPSPSPVAAPDPGAAPHATAAVRRQPLHRKWWLWTAVGGAVAVGLGVGLGVGLSQSSSSPLPQFSGVTF